MLMKIGIKVLYQKGVKKTLNYQAESLTSERSDDLNVELPIVKPYCGSRDHRPTSAQ